MFVLDEADDEDELERALAFALQRIIDRFPDEYRTALILDSLDGVPQAQIAQRLGISVSGAIKGAAGASETARDAV